MERLNPETLSGAFALFALVVVAGPVVAAMAVRSVEGMKWGFLVGVVLANLVVYISSPPLIVAMVVIAEVVVFTLVVVAYVNNHSYRRTELADGTIVREQGIGWQRTPSPAEQIELARGTADALRFRGAAGLVNAQVGMVRERRLLEDQRQRYYRQVAAGSWRELTEGSDEEGK